MTCANPQTGRPRGARFSRLTWLFCIVVIVAAGILSRTVHTGLAIFDKYLGDALYAAMVYAIFRLLWTGRVSAQATALSALASVTAIEFFQLTMIPARMLASELLLTRLCARLLGTQFSVLDLLAYAAGIACIYLLDTTTRNDPA